MFPLDPTARLTARTLAFLAPGLVHQLGNALFTVQGRAHLLGGEGADLDADRGAILEGIGRAHQGLQVLRWLSADADDDALGAAAVAAAVTAALRVPLRDRGFQLEAELDAAAAVAVPAAAFGRLLAESGRALVEAAGGSSGGILRLRLEVAAGIPDQVVVVVQLVAAPGALPFPVDVASVVDGLGPLLAGCAAWPVAADGGAAAVRERAEARAGGAVGGGGKARSRAASAVREIRIAVPAADRP